MNFSDIPFKLTGTLIGGLALARAFGAEAAPVDTLDIAKDSVAIIIDTTALNDSAYAAAITEGFKAAKIDQDTLFLNAVGRYDASIQKATENYFKGLERAQFVYDSTSNALRMRLEKDAARITKQRARALGKASKAK